MKRIYLSKIGTKIILSRGSTACSKVLWPQIHTYAFSVYWVSHLGEMTLPSPTRSSTIKERSSDFQAMNFMDGRSWFWFSPCFLWDPIYFFQSWSLDQGLVNCGPGAKSDWLPVFINKALLKCSQAFSFICCLWLLSWYNSRVERCDRDCVALFRTSVLTPSRDDSWNSDP